MMAKIELCLVEIGLAVMEKISKCRRCIFTISKLSPLVRGKNKLESRMLSFSLVEIG